MNGLASPRTALRLLALLLLVVPLGLATQVTHGATIHTDAAKHGGPALSKPLGSPADIEVGAAGNAFVSDWAYHRILKFSPTGKHLAQMLTPAGLQLPGVYNYLGAKFTGFLPEYLALDAKGQLYATANRYQMLKYSPSGKLLAHWVVPGAHGIAVDRQGNVYVSQWSSKAGVDGGVVKLSPTGKKLARWDALANLSGQVHHLGGLQVDDAGNVYVADYSNDRVEKLSPAGAALTTLGPSIDGYKVPSKNSPGTTIDVLGCACDVELDRAGNVYINDSGSMKYLKLRLPAPWSPRSPIPSSPDPSPSTATGTSTWPLGVCSKCLHPARFWRPGDEAGHLEVGTAASTPSRRESPADWHASAPPGAGPRGSRAQCPPRRRARTWRGA